VKFVIILLTLARTAAICSACVNGATGGNREFSRGEWGPNQVLLPQWIAVTAAIRDPWVPAYLREKVISQLRDSEFGCINQGDYSENTGVGVDGAESLG
jgi:hypothetical protein